MSKVSVDDYFAHFGAKSYAINKIMSVDVPTEQVAAVHRVMPWGEALGF